MAAAAGRKMTTFQSNNNNNNQRRPRSPSRRFGVYCCCCLLFGFFEFGTLRVSAKLRVPKPFASEESQHQQQQHQEDNHGVGSDQIPQAGEHEHNYDTIDTKIDEYYKEIDNDNINSNNENSNNENIKDGAFFDNWFSQRLERGAHLEQTLDGATIANNDDDNPGIRELARPTGGRTYGIPLSSFSLASLTSQEYFLQIEKRFQRILRFYDSSQAIVSRGLQFLWKTTNDVVRYKFPVGIVSAWSAVVVTRKIFKIKETRRKKRDNNGDDQEDRRSQEIPDTYRYVLRHTGRALDLDADDFTSYRHLGGIEQIRSRLLRSAFSETESSRQRSKAKATEKEQLVEALLAALSMEFIPGGSHSEYIHKMIPSFAKAEEYAHRLRLLPSGIVDETPQHRSGHHHLTRHQEKENNNHLSLDADDDEKRLLSMALQTAEVRILDSKLRSIRDRLIRTTYRLDRTVKYWKSKVESERLASSLMATTTTGKRFAFFSSSPIQRLKLRWSRLFNFGSSSSGSSSSTTTRNHPNFVHNSLLEGDRLRLAFAEAAYNTEIVRLGKILLLLAKRPEEMPDSTLTNALVEQQRLKREEKEQHSKGGEIAVANTIPAPIHRFRTMAAATKERIAKSFDRNKKTTNPSVVEKTNTLSTTVLKPFKALWAYRRQRWEEYKRRPKRNRFLAIRFNADGRGKFSVQTYDEGSVAIESDTAKRILLRNYYTYQEPWLKISNAWALEARGLIVDTIRGTAEASINPLGGGNNININSSGEAATKELNDVETTWRVRKYAGPSVEVAEEESKSHRQWMFVYEMSRDINRLKRVGEGKSLKFKWKEVHWIHWLLQWNLVGLPSAALKIWAAMWIHEQSKPFVPKVQEISREAYTTTLEILTTRFWTPFKDLVVELTSRKQTLVTGLSLAEEEASLDIMLQDLDLGDGTPATRHEATIQATRQYESYMRSGLMLHALGGRLARLMLIQVQQLKVSMLDAAETIDVLFQSNKINMQLLAVIPAVGILFFGAKVFVRFLFSVRAKDLRPIASVHADMTDYLNELESNIILRKSKRGSSDDIDPTSNTIAAQGTTHNLEEEELGEFALTLYNYLLLLDYSSPQPFSSRQCDVIHQSLATFLGKNGSFGKDSVTADGQSRLLDNIKGKHQDLAKFL